MLNLPENSRLNVRLTNSICMQSIDHFVSSIKLGKKRVKNVCQSCQVLESIFNLYFYKISLIGVQVLELSSVAKVPLFSLIYRSVYYSLFVFVSSKYFRIFLFFFFDYIIYRTDVNCSFFSVFYTGFISQNFRFCSDDYKLYIEPHLGAFAQGNLSIFYIFSIIIIAVITANSIIIITISMGNKSERV